MAKTQTKTRVAPEQYGFTQPVVGNGTTRGALLVAQAQHWAHGRRRQSWLGLSTGPDGWDSSGNAVGTLRAIPTSSVQTLIDTDRWVDSYQRSCDLTFYAECQVTGALPEQVRLIATITGSLGSISRTLDFDTSHNGAERSGSLTGLSGVCAEGEWVRITVTMQRIGGTGTAHEVIEVEIEEQEQTSSLPDPDDD